MLYLLFTIYLVRCFYLIPSFCCFLNFYWYGYCGLYQIFIGFGDLLGVVLLFYTKLFSVADVLLGMVLLFYTNFLNASVDLLGGMLLFYTNFPVLLRFYLVWYSCFIPNFSVGLTFYLVRLHWFIPNFSCFHPAVWYSTRVLAKKGFISESDLLTHL